MSFTRDFAVEPLGHHADDIEPPLYDASAPPPPEYDGPPKYRASVCEDGEIIVIDRRLYADPRQVRLSPLEVILLKQGHHLPIALILPKVSKEGRGFRATFKWFYWNYVATKHLWVTRDNIDDYGRWVES